MSVNKALELIGSKWFITILALAMVGVLPITYGNFIIVFKAGEMGSLWWVPTVFIVNLLAAIMSIYKATSMFLKKKRDDTEEWE